MKKYSFIIQAFKITGTLKSSRFGMFGILKPIFNVYIGYYTV